MRVSIITPTFNRAKWLQPTIDSLLAQKFLGANVDYWIVDNNSTDETCEIVQDIIKRNSTGISVHYLFEQKQGINYARNTGIANSQGEFVIGLDDDVLLEQGWLQAYIDAFKEFPHESIFGGKVKLKPPDFIVPQWLALSGRFVRSMIVLSLDRGDGNSIESIDESGIPLGPNMAFQRKLLDKHGVFRTDLGLKGKSLIPGSEYELIFRFRDCGIPGWVYVGKAIAYHPLKAEQARRSYFRQRLLGVGRVTYRLHSFPAKWRVAGLPVYVLGFLCKNLLSSLCYKILGNSQASFYYETEAFVNLGFIAEHFSQLLKRKT